MVFAQAKYSTINYENDTLRIRVSTSDINRFVFDSEILEYFTSDEKNVIINTNGKNAFVKFAPIKELKSISSKNNQKIINGKIKYSGKKTDVFFVTSKAVYSIILVPKKIESRTIYINNNSMKTDSIIKFETKYNDYEKFLKTYITNAFLDIKPKEYKVDDHKLYIDLPNNKIKLYKSYTGKLYGIYYFTATSIFNSDIEYKALKVALQKIGISRVLASSFENNKLIVIGSVL
jgi:hypothetical protein